MLSKIRNFLSWKESNGEPVSVQICPIHGRTVFLQHMVNSRCALCDGYTQSEISKIIRRIKSKGKK